MAPTGPPLPDKYESLWLDDVRRPYPGFTHWARTAEDGRSILRDRTIEVASLDHDLGGHDLDPDDPDTLYFRGDAEDSGYSFVTWMIKHDLVPRLVYIHSWSTPGAERMQAALRNAIERGLISNRPTVVRAPYVPRIS